MCKSFKYKGFRIDYDSSPRFGDTYYSVANNRITYKNENGQKKNPHVHRYSEKKIKMVIDCYIDIKYGKFNSNFNKKYSRTIRNEALKLFNYKVCY